jgi:hypothetical protein
MKNKGEKLVPVGTDGTIPNHTIESNLTGKVEIDQQAIVHNPKTCKAIFEDGMQSGLFNECKNAAQVNSKIASIRNNGKPAPYMVSEIAHAWSRTETGWVKRSDAELAADPFIPGVRGERKSSLILDPLEVDALKAQQIALSVLKDNPAIVPLLEAINGKLKAHEAALLDDATRQANVKKRAAILEKVKEIVYNSDKVGVDFIKIVIDLKTGDVLGSAGE